MLPRDRLHGAFIDRLWATFLSGDYDTAVFQAFKEVEVAVRTACNLTDDDFGAPLMRRAFDKNTGPLRDPEAVGPEREALAHLFAGAMGVFKNPDSHRNVALTDASEASDTIMLANLLLRILEKRAAAMKDAPAPPAV